jgi:hypothetical protein
VGNDRLTTSGRPSEESFLKGAGLITYAGNPDPPFFIISGINTDLVVTSNPIPICVMSGYPDLFAPLGNPNPVNFPMARRLEYHRGGRMNGCPMVAMLGREDRGRIPILK